MRKIRKLEVTVSMKRYGITLVFIVGGYVDLAANLDR